jgi:hypothetical protein
MRLLVVARHSSEVDRMAKPHRKHRDDQTARAGHATGAELDTQFADIFARLAVRNEVANILRKRHGKTVASRTTNPKTYADASESRRPFRLRSLALRSQTDLGREVSLLGCSFCGSTSPNCLYSPAWRNTCHV